MNAQDRLPVRRKLLFSTGDLSTSLPVAITMFFQLFFLTDVAGLNPALAGLAVGIGKVWDSINDPLFGIFSDRLRTRWGRRRALLLFGAAPLGLTYMLMWFIPPFNQIGLTIYYAVTFILFDTAFTAIHVSYNALTPEMTQDYDERSSLNGYRMVFSVGGTLGAVILATVLGMFIADKHTLFMILGISLGLVSIIPPLVVFKVASEKPAEEQPESLSIKESLLLTLSNRPFQMVMGLYLLSWTTASILGAVLVYFATYYLRVPEQANYFVLVAEFSAILFIPLWVRVAQKLDKRRAFIWGSATWIAVLMGISLIRADQVALAYLLAALGGSGLATAFVIPWSMLPDIIEYDQLKTGQRREGAFYSFAAFFQKLATALAIWAMGQTLAWTGYLTPTAANPFPVQPPDAVIAIRVFAGPVPTALLILAILFAWRYPISRESHRAMRDQLAQTMLENK